MGGGLILLPPASDGGGGEPWPLKEEQLGGGKRGAEGKDGPLKERRRIGEGEGR